MLFNIFINKAVVSSVPSASLLITPSWVVQLSQQKEAIQRDLDKLKKWAQENLMRFNKAKCKALHLGQGNPRLWEEFLEISPSEALVILVDNKLEMSWQHAVSAWKASSILGCIKRRVTSRAREMDCSHLLCPFKISSGENRIKKVKDWDRLDSKTLQLYNSPLNFPQKGKTPLFSSFLNGNVLGVESP